MDQTNETRLGSAPLGKLLFQLGLPGVAAQVINVLYNIVDRIYIGNIPGIGDMALTGVGVTLPVIMVIAAFSAFVGMGGAPLASIRLGARDHEGAERILGSCIVSLLSLSVILMAVFFAFQRPLLFAFGASENVIGYAQDYLTIYLFGTLFVQLALGLNTFISAQGKAKTAMLSVLIGAVLNIVLDPLFIFVFHMGRARCGAGDHSFAGGVRGVGDQLPAGQTHGNPGAKKIPPLRLEDHWPSSGPGYFALYYAGDREPCDHHAQQRPSSLWRGSVCRQHDHFDECTPTDRYAD